MVTFAAVYLYAFPYFDGLRSAAEVPRVLTTVQLVTRGTVRLDERMSDLGSKFDIATPPDGHHYQNKAPGLSFLGAAAYAPLALTFGLWGGTPSLRQTTWVLRVVVVTIPSLLFLIVFRRVAARFAPDEPSQNAALVAYALGSMAFPYGLLFMSHVPAAAAVGAAFACAIRVTRGEAASPVRTALLVGALLGLATFVEYQAVFAAVIIAIFTVARAPGRVTARASVAAAIAATAAPFVCALALYQARCFGSPFRTGYTYSEDEANRVGFLGIVGPSVRSVAQLLTHSSNGIAFVSPWTVVAVLGAVVLFRDPRARERAGPEAALAVIVVLVYLVFVASLAPEFGRAGWSVGPRYVAVAMPFVGWLAAAGLAALERVRGERKEERLGLALHALAHASIVVGVVINVVAATTFPHWPTDLKNPLYELSFRLLREGYAPWSLGSLFGLRGLAALAPLYVAVVWLTSSLLWSCWSCWRCWRCWRRPRSIVGIGLTLALAVGILVADRYVPHTTSDAVQSEVWAYVMARWEP
jgi:hypothetical protein